MQNAKFRRNIFLLTVIFAFLLLIPGWQTLAAPPSQDSLAIISYPGNNEVVRGIISVTGSAVHPQFERFQLAYAPEPVTQNNQWIIIGSERTEQVVNGELGIWDTNLVPDGSYSLRLRVIRLDGNYDEIEVKQIVVANTQPSPTPTSEPELLVTAQPTATPTPLPPTPTINIQVVPENTPTPRPLTITQVLPTPRPDDASIIPIPTIEFDSAPLKSACIWGGGAMLILFLFFGFLSALRIVVMGFANRTKRKK